jgi:hypothetical protein
MAPTPTPHEQDRSSKGRRYKQAGQAGEYAAQLAGSFATGTGWLARLPITVRRLRCNLPPWGHHWPPQRV